MLYNRPLSLLYVIISVATLLGCTLNRERLVTTDTADTEFVCAAPPPEVVATSGSLNADADITGVVEVAKANISVEQKIQRIRESTDGTFTFQAVEYRLCLQRTQGFLSEDNYVQMLTDILPKLTEKIVLRTVMAVKDENGEPLIGSSVIANMNGETIGEAVTDIDGKAVIDLPITSKDKQVDFVISYGGFGTETVTRTVGSDTVLDVIIGD